MNHEVVLNNKEFDLIISTLGYQKYQLSYLMLNRDLTQAELNGIRKIMTALDELRTKLTSVIPYPEVDETYTMKME